jgi:REP element-mobilizing transposase RayT
VNTRFTPTWWKFEYVKNNLSAIIQAFKSITTNTYIKNVEENNWISFNKKLWQKNYYEHIIRDEIWYEKISEYIANNPIKWDEDTFYYTEIF